MTGKALILVIAAVTSFGCVHVAEDRARRDAEIGHVERDGASVVVADGLATIRAFDPAAGELDLWAQAPTLAIRLRPAPGGPAEWRVTLRNVVVDSLLTARTAAGDRLPVTKDAYLRTTVQRWIVRTGNATDVALELGTLDEDETAPWRFVVYADVQDALDDVEDVYDVMDDDPTIRFAIMAGDLTEQGSAKELEEFERRLAALPVPVFATLGNHELGTRDDLFHDRFGRGSFSFAFRGVRFTLLDSASATLAPAVHEWLDGWLDAGADRFHAVFMHIPPLDPVGVRNGSFASRTEAHRLVSRLARAGVDLTVYGHIHTFEAFANAGIPAFISGGGGALPDRLDGIGRHFLVVDVWPDTQRFQVGVVRVD